MNHRICSIYFLLLSSGLDVDGLKQSLATFEPPAKKLKVAAPQGAANKPAGFAGHDAKAPNEIPTKLSESEVKAEIARLSRELASDDLATEMPTLDERALKREIAKVEKELALTQTGQSRKRKYSTMTQASGKVYCVCKMPYDQMMPMIACDGCDEWYSVGCICVVFIPF